MLLQSPVHRIKRKVRPRPNPARNQEQQSSDHETCCRERVDKLEIKGGKFSSDAPNNPRHIELDIKYMADMAIPKLPYHLARP